jgi:hypothetical protein
MQDSQIVLIIVIAIFLLLQVLKSAIKIPVGVKIAIYVAAALYFIYLNVFHYHPEQSSQIHAIRIAITVGLIAYYGYQIQNLLKRRTT